MRVIGEVTDTNHMVLEFDGEIVCDIPLGPLASDAPKYDRPHLSRDEYTAHVKVKPLGDIPESTDIGADLLKLMASPALASRRWIWEQYDSQVGADTAQLSGGDAAVVRIHGTNKALAMSTDCTPRYCYADPYEGGKQAVAECYRNLCAVGAKPLATTDCMNFGNPEKPHIMGQFVGCIEGIAEACEALDMPIVSGNVSLYNETMGADGLSHAILPTPAIGGVGLMDDVSKMMTIGFKESDETILLIGENNSQLSQSLWLRELHGREDGPPPSVELNIEKANGDFVRQLIGERKVTAVHDVSDGGLMVALAEMALQGKIGAEIDTPTGREQSWAEFFFGEKQGRYLVTVHGDCEPIKSKADAQNIALTEIGVTFRSDDFNDIQVGNGDDDTPVAISDLREAHESFFRDWMED